MRKYIFAIALAVSAVAAPAWATIRYEFTAFSSFPAAYFVFGAPPETISGSFTIETPTFISPARTFQPADLLSFSAAGSLTGALNPNQQIFDADAFNDYVIFGFSDPFNSGGAAAYYFAPGAFSSPGTYQTVLFGADQAGRLVVTNLGGGVVPEPASWAMLIAGFGLVGAAQRRRRRILAA